MAGGHGGPRPNSGRKRGSKNKKTELLIQAVDVADAVGITPLQYMLETLRNPKTEAFRKDEMARAAAPFVHPKLNAVATVDASANSCPPLEIQIFAVPRGAQIDASGRIVWPDGTPATAAETAFTPFAATPDLLPALPSPEPAPADEPLPVFEPEAEDDDKVERLDSWRDRKRDDEPGSGAA
jgi:hypothetical protein